jgi:hypothetical protein
MNPARRAFLRDVMEMAWSLYRAELNGPRPRTFADALSGSWAWYRAREARHATRPAWVKAKGPRQLSLRSMLQSSIRRELGGKAHAGDRFRSANYTTSVVGR